LNIEIILFSIVEKMTLNNLENRLDQQEKKSYLNNKVFTTVALASVLSSASAAAEMNGTTLHEEIIKSNKNELVQTLSNKSEEEKAVTANYKEVLSKLGNQVEGQKDGEPVKLDGAEKQAVVDEFKTSFHINGDSLNISQVSVDDPKIFDLTTKKYISESQRTANGKYAYVQDYFLDATMNPNKDQKYADKLKTVDMNLLVQKVMKDNRHELKINKF